MRPEDCEERESPCRVPSVAKSQELGPEGVRRKTMVPYKMSKRWEENPPAFSLDESGLG